MIGGFTVSQDALRAQALTYRVPHHCGTGFDIDQRRGIDGRAHSMGRDNAAG